MFRFILFILAVILVSIAVIVIAPAFPASAEEPAARPRTRPATAKAPAQTVAIARATYLEALHDEFSKIDFVTLEDVCKVALNSYLDASADLDRIDRELRIPANDSLGPTQVEYRNKLEIMKSELETKIAKAKNDAKTTGTIIVDTKKRQVALDNEIERLEGDARWDAVPSRTATNNDRAVALGYLQDDAIRARSRRQRVASIVAPPVEPRQDVRGYLSGDTGPTTLPDEFAGCFPTPDLLGRVMKMSQRHESDSIPTPR